MALKLLLESHESNALLIKPARHGTGHQHSPAIPFVASSVMLLVASQQEFDYIPAEGGGTAAQRLVGRVSCPDS